jgi:hypothetical protein
MIERFYPGKKVVLTTATREYENDEAWNGELTVSTSDETGVLAHNEAGDARWMARKGLKTAPPPMVDSMSASEDIVPELPIADIARPVYGGNESLTEAEETALREEVKEAALRFNKGKPPLRYLLVFGAAVREVAKVCAYGESKYEMYNFCKGAPRSENVDSLLRHLEAYWNGEDYDTESGCHHLAHVSWNALRLCQEALMSAGTDDRGGYRK